jgi:hypothetical protein
LKFEEKPLKTFVSNNTNYSNTETNQAKQQVNNQNTISSVPITYNTNNTNYSNENKATNKKKRDRDIEYNLLNGNLSVIDDVAIAKEINVSHAWNPEKYKEQQEREASVQKEFSLTHGSSFMQPTKTQNRKHQLTSLVFKAAQTELALLESRSSKMKTKSETQGKYGW